MKNIKRRTLFNRVWRKNLYYLLKNYDNTWKFSTASSILVSPSKISKD